MKIAKVILIYKSGSRKDVNNYRPICFIISKGQSLLSLFSKLIEKIVKSRLIEFFSLNKSFYVTQFRFQEELNIEMAALFDSSIHRSHKCAI